MDEMDNKADSDVREVFLWPYTEKQPSPALFVDQSKFTTIHFKDLNHNNAVAKATAKAAVSLFNLEIGQFFLRFENFTTTESFTAEYPARKALLSWPRHSC